jgi:hypothetical protein
MKKRAWIRGSDKEKKCPFGLPITLACHNAGEATAHMCPLEAVPPGKQKAVAEANKRVYIHSKTGTRCMYAHNIMDQGRAVNCDFGDAGAGMNTPAFSGSPLYAQTFSGIGLDGLYAFPLGFYADNNESRNLFQGLFSLLGERASEIIKEAMDECDETLWRKIESGEELTPEERGKMESLVEECRRKFEGCRTDPAKIMELSRKYNPRLGR